jgi:hypothetical protein
MKRRGILAALIAGVVRGQNFTVSPSTEVFLQVEVESHPKYFLIIRADGREVKFTTKEVMDILESK